jgi:hypothetical protein
MKTLICSNPPSKETFIQLCIQDWAMLPETADQLYTILSTEYTDDSGQAWVNLLNAVRTLMGCIFLSSINTEDGIMDYISVGDLDSLTIAFRFNKAIYDTTYYTIEIASESDLMEKYETKEENNA